MSVRVIGEPRAFKAAPLPSVTTFEVSNRSMWMGLNDGRLFRYPCDDLSSSPGARSKIRQAECITFKTTLPNVACDVESVFLDAKSFHSIVCLSSGDNWYLNFQSENPILLNSLKGVHMRSLAFTDASTEDFTGPFLIGTQNGAIIEGKVNYKQGTYSFHTRCYMGDSEPVLDIRIVPIVHKGCRTLVIIALSTRRLYEFFGGSSLESTLKKYSNGIHSSVRYEVPLAGPKGELLVEEREDGSHDLFWVNTTAIIHANIPYSIKDDATSCMPISPTVITYPCNLRPISSSQETKINQGKLFLRSPAIAVPKSSVASKNTIMLLFEDNISVVNMIVGKQVATVTLAQGKFGKLRFLTQDEITGEIWLLTSKGVFQLTICDDNDDSWQHYLMRGDTESALAACKTAGQRDSVLLKSAYDLFEQERFMDAARMFGQVRFNNLDFDNICLNLLKQKPEDAVLEYTSLKLKHRRWHIHDPRFVIITIWIIEMLCYRYRDLFLTIEACSLTGADDLKSLNKKLEEFKRSLFSTIDSVVQVEDMTPTVSFLLQTIMGCGEESVEFARLHKDYSNVICYHISSGNTEGAFSELLNMPCGDKRDALLLRFSPLLFMNKPELFYKVSFSKLEPAILVPVILLPLMMEGSRYLPHSISITERLISDDTCKDGYTKSLIWCCYIILLSNLDTTDKLLKVLASCNANFGSNDFAIAMRYLKRKSESNKQWVVPFIMLQSLCGLDEEALDMALSQGNVELAKTCANRPSDECSKRKLWRRILKHYIAGDDIHISSILDWSNGILKVNDLLELIPPGMKMNQLQSVIKETLQSYESNLQKRRQEIECLCKCIEESKTEMKMATTRCVNLGGNKGCTICGNRLTTSSFMVYQCSHMFHRVCVARTLRRMLTGPELLELENLHTRFSKVGDRTSVTAYNDYLSRGCLICGHNVEMFIKKPFITAGDLEQAELWCIK